MATNLEIKDTGVIQTTLNDGQLVHLVRYPTTRWENVGVVAEKLGANGWKFTAQVGDLPPNALLGLLCEVKGTCVFETATGPVERRAKGDLDHVGVKLYNVRVCVDEGL